MVLARWAIRRKRRRPRLLPRRFRRGRTTPNRAQSRPPSARPCDHREIAVPEDKTGNEGHVVLCAAASREEALRRLSGRRIVSGPAGWATNGCSIRSGAKELSAGATGSTGTHGQSTNAELGSHRQEPSEGRPLDHMAQRAGPLYLRASALARAPLGHRPRVDGQPR
jgi:hypothetical protein